MWGRGWEKEERKGEGRELSGCGNQMDERRAKVREGVGEAPQMDEKGEGRELSGWGKQMDERRAKGREGAGQEPQSDEQAEGRELRGRGRRSDKRGAKGGKMGWRRHTNERRRARGRRRKGIVTT